MEAVDKQSIISPERKRIGKLLYIFAWIIEALAVTIGMSIAIMQMITAFSEVQEGSNNSFANITNVIIAGLPFIMVAAVELTKIPFTEAFYYTSKKIWKLIFGLSLLFIAFITFESAINGFERNFTAMTYTIDKFKKNLVAVEEQIPVLKEERSRYATLTPEKIESDYNARHALLSSERDNQVSIIQQRISALRASIQSESAELKREQIAAKSAQIQSIYSQRDDEIALQNENYQQQLSQVDNEVSVKRRSLQNQLNAAKQELREVRERAFNAIEEASIFTSKATREREEGKVRVAEVKVSELEVELNNIDALSLKNQIRESHVAAIQQIREGYSQQVRVSENELEALTLQLNQMIGSRERDIEKTIESHQSEIATVEKGFATQRAENDIARDEQYALLDGNEERISIIDEKLDKLREERLELRQLINEKVGDNQVFRMAQWFYGRESAADLERDEVMRIALIWFGSLAALIAFTGIMLALASCVIGDPKIRNKDGQTRGTNRPLFKLINTARRYVTYRRRLDRKPKLKEVQVEIVKEVPVQKVVLTEKPIEIIKKELVHVPVYTNDKELLKRNPQVEL